MSTVSEHLPTPVKSCSSVVSDSQATQESLAHTISGHTSPCGSISEFKTIEPMLTSLTIAAESNQQTKCQCEPAIAAIKDPVIARSVLAKLKELHNKHSTGSHTIHKETNTAETLRKHINECLNITSPNWSLKSGTDWARQSFDRSDSIQSYTSEMLSRYKHSNSHSGPSRNQRSMIFKATGEYVDNEAAELLNRTNTLKESVTESYLKTIGDLGSLPDGQLNWTKVSELESAIWMEHENPKVSTEITQNSLKNYVQILEQALKSCAKRAKHLMEEGKEFYDQTHGEVSTIQLQRLAHFRLLMKDTQKQIELTEKILSQPNLFTTVPQEAEQMQQKRWPLITPVRRRERYARQIRVLVEMLVLLEEMLRNIQHPENEDHLKLFE